MSITLEEFVENSDLELVYTETDRVETRIRKGKGVVSQRECICCLQVPNFAWQILVFLPDGRSGFLVAGVSRESREEARRLFVEQIRGTQLCYTPLAGHDRSMKHIPVPPDLE